MGLFDKKYCDICKNKIGLLGNRKLEDGNLCKDCAKKLSPWCDDRRHSTVQKIAAQLEYREKNKEVFRGPHLIFKQSPKNGRFLSAVLRYDALFGNSFIGIHGEENILKLKEIISNYPNIEKTELLPFRKLCQTKYDNMKIEFPLKDVLEPSKETMDNLKELIKKA